MKSFILSVLSLCLLAACAPDRQPEGQSRPEAKRIPGPPPQLTSITFTREDTVLQYSARVTYPGIREDLAFNQAVQDALKSALDTFEAFIRDFSGGGRTLNSEYQPVQASDTVVSIRQVYEWAVPGTSTLQYDFHNINYDPSARRLITLEALFKPGEDYRSLLRRRLQDKIRASFKVKVDVTDADLATFTIGGNYLEFYKVLYPEVMEPEPKAIRIEFSELKGRLRWM